MAKRKIAGSSLAEIIDSDDRLVGIGKGTAVVDGDAIKQNKKEVTINLVPQKTVKYRQGGKDVTLSKRKTNGTVRLEVEVIG